LDDFEEGPKQASPDYYGINKHFEFEQKVFMKSPGFDIGNFTSYINMLCEFLHVRNVASLNSNS